MSRNRTYGCPRCVLLKRDGRMLCTYAPMPICRRCHYPMILIWGAVPKAKGTKKARKRRLRKFLRGL